MAVTLTPDAGSASLTGLAPTVRRTNSWATIVRDGKNAWFPRFDGADRALAPAAGTAAVEGFAPSLSVNQTTAADVGAAELEGYAPTLAVAQFASPDVAAAAIEGFAPLSLVSLEQRPAEATIAGHAPSVDLAAVQSAGAAELAGYAPVLAVSLAVPAGAAAIEGFAPTPNESYRFVPAPATLGLDGDPLDSIAQFSVVVAFPFLASAQGFTGTAGAGTTMAWTGASGNPLGSLATTTTGTSRDATNTWTLATDWITLGVPANSTITAVRTASAQSRVSTYTGGDGGSVAAATLTPTGEPPLTLAASRSITGSEAGWTTSSGTDATGLAIPANGSLVITLGSNLRTAATGTPTVTLLQDNLTFVVRYTAARTVSPELGAASIEGYAPTVTAVEPEIPANAWFARLTDGKNTWSPRWGVGSVSCAPDAAALAVAGYAPLVVIANPTAQPAAADLAIEGLAPRVTGIPVALLGEDYLDSDVATLTASVGRVIAAGDKIGNVSLGALALAGLAPAAQETHRRAPAAGTAEFAGHAPAVAADHTVAATVGALTLDGLVPSVVLASPTAQPAAGAASITGLAPIVFSAENPVWAPAAAEARLIGFRPGLSVGSTLAPDAGAAELAGLAPTLGYGKAFGLTPAVLGFAGTVLLLQPLRTTVALAAGAATTAATTTLTRTGEGELQSAQPLAFAGSGARTLTGSGALDSGPASLRGNVYVVDQVIASGAARILARGRVVDYEPPRRRLKPTRVNRYTVVLKPSPRLRVRRMNHRKPHSE